MLVGSPKRGSLLVPTNMNADKSNNQFQKRMEGQAQIENLKLGNATFRDPLLSDTLTHDANMYVSMMHACACRCVCVCVCRSEEFTDV